MTQAFGMLYQWGRKDPFPPLRNVVSEHHDYNDEHTDLHYDNSNQIEVHKTSGTDENKLFHSVIGSTLTGAVRHAIANPTVFITGTNDVNRNESYVQQKLSLIHIYKKAMSNIAMESMKNTMSQRDDFILRYFRSVSVF